jgi:DNA modification methylase
MKNLATPNPSIKPLSELKPDPRNARLHSKQQIRQIARSIQSFGFNVPVLVDNSNKILCGHGRVEAAKSLGLEQISVIQLDHLSEAQARAFAIADNRLTENASWNEQLLGEIFSELSVLDLDFSLEDTGFSMGEIDLRIESLQSQAKPEPLDTLPDPLPQVVSQPGDLWLLGKHRILCGSALEAGSFGILMQGKKADLIFTDPPYNVRIDGHVSGKGKAKHAEFAMASGEMTVSEFTQFLETALGLLASHSKSGSIHFICMDWRHLPETLEAGSRAYSELKNLCVWVKDKGGMGSLYRSQHELVLVYKHGKESHRNNVELGKFGRNRTNVWEYAGANTLSRQGHEGDLLAMHPTVKPINLVADALLDCSARKDIVLDSFLGSGSTLLAAERTGRICYGLELSPSYVDLAICRWQGQTGEQAIHALTGQTFGERLAARSESVESEPSEVCHG